MTSLNDSRQAVKKPFRYRRTSMACAVGTRGEYLSPDAQKGRLARLQQAKRQCTYSGRYGEPLNEARTPLTDLFSILPVEELHASEILPVLIT